MLGVSLETVLDNLKDFKDQPFFQFLDMSDCNGTIGPGESKIIAGDFINNKNKFSEGLGDEEEAKWMMQTYEDWITAFTTAAQDGIVMFH